MLPKQNFSNFKYTKKPSQEKVKIIGFCSLNNQSILVLRNPKNRTSNESLQKSIKTERVKKGI